MLSATDLCHWPMALWPIAGALLLCGDPSTGRAWTYCEGNERGVSSLSPDKDVAEEGARPGAEGEELALWPILYNIVLCGPWRDT